MKDHYDQLRERLWKKGKRFFFPALGPVYDVASLSGPETGQVAGNRLSGADC